MRTKAFFLYIEFQRHVPWDVCIPYTRPQRLLGEQPEQIPCKKYFIIIKAQLTVVESREERLNTRWLVTRNTTRPQV